MTKNLAYQQALKRIEQAQQANAKRLNLISSWFSEPEDQLTELPPEITQLTNLEYLYVRNNQLTVLPEEITQLVNLQELNISNNQLTVLPEEITQLVNLQKLNLSDNQLTVLPKEIEQLISLKKLNLSNNQLTILPNSIGQLTNLTELDLQNNPLTILPESIAKLTNLTALNLINNQLTVFPDSISQLTNLRKLHLENNQLTVLPDSISQLVNLIGLYLHNNQLTSLPQSISNLKKLIRLSLSNNQLTILPEEIFELKNLCELFLSNNYFVKLPESLSQLSQLRELHLDNNRLTKLPSTISKLYSLETLSLHDNQLTTLPEGLGRLKTLIGFSKKYSHWRGLNISNNPLPIPWEIFSQRQGAKGAMLYYLDCMEQGSQLLNEVKVILVGQGTVGKTSLVKRLCNEGFNPTETKTDGIAIRNIELNLSPRKEYDHTVQLNIWDFGGQEIMHATHQFFLTNRSLYLLLINNRNTEEENRLEYWLNTIESFAADSPVIVVGNKSDEHPLDLNEKELTQKYPNIKAFLSISCKKNSYIKTLLQKIRKEIKVLPHVGDVLPKRWFDVKERLENLDKNYIPYEEYADICTENAIDDDEKQKSLVSLLHDLGIVLNFHDDPTVSDTHVINPEWLTAGIYCIINYPALTTQYKGVLSYSLLAKILPKKLYPTHKHQFIIAMMKKFELCFDLSSDSVLIPNLLPKSAPEALDEAQWQDSLRFEYHYPILSQSVISRFIVKMQHRIANKTWWRTGVVLSSGQNAALIKADLYDKKIFIKVNGTPQTRRDFLAAIRDCFASINKTFSDKSQPEEKIPIPDYPELPPIDYEYLIDLECMGEESFVPPGLRKRISVRELLNSIEPIAMDSEKFLDRVNTVYVDGDLNIDQSTTQFSGDVGVGKNNGEITGDARAVGKYNEAP